MLIVNILQDRYNLLFSEIENSLMEHCEVVSADKSLDTRTAVNADILMCKNYCASRENSVVVIGSDESVISTKIEQNSIVLVESTNYMFLRQENFSKMQVIDCGISPKSTITFSSVGMDGTVIALQRSIILKNGKSIEPQELPLVLPQSNQYSALLTGAILLILDNI